VIVLIWVAALLIAFSVEAAAQTPQDKTAPQATAPALPPSDPFGRDTPRGTIAGFNQAVHREDFATAARYLQLTAAQRRNVERLSRDLTYLIDRYFARPLSALSDQPEGTPDDEQPRERDRAELTVAGKTVNLDLVRVKDAGGLVWLISSQTLAQVPALRRSAADSWLERLEALLGTSSVFGISVATWTLWAATIVVPLLILWLLSKVVTAIGRRTITDPKWSTLLESAATQLLWPLIVLITIVFHVAFMRLLGLSLRFRVVYSRVALSIAVVFAAWFIWRLLGLTLERARMMAQRAGQSGIRSLLSLAERVSKAIIVMVAIFVVLTIAGVDTTTALAGVGLGGVAIALGAQKSVENLLGGVFLLTDRALAIGDTCSISNRIGVVEDVTLRSVRLRTVEQTLLSVPAGVLSQSNVENFATRNKILVQTMLRLRYGTTADQLRRLLGEIRTLLHEHPQIETATARIRLVDFGIRAIELELFAYVLTPDFLTFLSVREDLLLQVAKMVETSGTSFAQPELNIAWELHELGSAQPTP
jgi:MscS family membrane protein